MSKLKLLVIGHGRHGKDTVCEMLRDSYGYTFESSSKFCSNKREFFAMQNTGVFDYCIWVDRSMHLEAESKDSMSLEQWMANFTIDNNGTLEDLKFNLGQLMSHLEVRT